jgi:iron complex outermembrane recepter protein
MPSWSRLHLRKNKRNLPVTNLTLLKLVTVGVVALSLCNRGSASTSSDSDKQKYDISAMSLEQLTTIEVSSFSRKDQELFKTPAAIFVITREDIRSSGASSLPELFRIVPGMQVAQVYANEWAVSARGFNSRFADKMLVLIDGRSIYSEIYSGVFWDQNDLLLEDIDRIEVIRGPGGTLWGANAVNGIINIITSKASHTLGTQIVAEAGRMDNEASIRYGATIGDKIQYRTSLKFLRRNQLLSDDGTPAGDAGDALRGAARIDWQAKQKDWLTFHGDIYRGSEGQHVYPALPTSDFDWVADSVKTGGGYGLTRWEHRFDGSDIALQAYFTQESHEENAGTGREHSFDIDFQHHLHPLKRNDIVWGAGYRLTTDKISGDPLPFLHARHRDTLTSLFFEDDYSLVPGKLVLTGGTKLQHNSYTGIEFQPGARALWTPNSQQSIWSSISRAVRTPSVQDRDLHFFQALPAMGPLPITALALGNPEFRSEVVLAYETGYRQRLGRLFSADIASFINEYTHLRDQQPLTPYLMFSPAPTVVAPILYTNGMKTSSHGVEAAISWTPLASLRFQTSYAWANARLRLIDDQPVVNGDHWSTPTNTLNVRGTWAFARSWSLYSSLYSVSKLDRASELALPVGAYQRLDAHISYSLGERVQLSAGADNLLRSRHAEFNPQDGYSIRSQVPRSAFAKIVWYF